MTNCFVCGERTKERYELCVKKRGVETLLSASIARGDEEHERMLRTVDSVGMHPACYKDYADKRSGTKRRHSHETSRVSSSSTTVEPQVPPIFDFKNCCLFLHGKICGFVGGNKAPHENAMTCYVSHKKFALGYNFQTS
ncbi:unnamed protein product [Lasius platythorax]|uniref:Uncharacterized protein n=1 Tax=Lasius platythorax TaxID=488582 RepID=A0AAV2MYR3_9HYME